MFSVEFCIVDLHVYYLQVILRKNVSVYHSKYNADIQLSVNLRPFKLLNLKPVLLTHTLQKTSDTQRSYASLEFPKNLQGMTVCF